MRIRKKPWAEEELAQNDHVMKNAEALKGKCHLAGIKIRKL